MSADGTGVLAGLQILVVEDEPASARLAQMVLRRAGAVVQIAASAADATRILFGGMRPAAVSLDLDLPDLPGTDLVKVLRSLDHLRDVPIVACTASGIAFGERAAMSAGCDGFMRKPIDPWTFAAQIAEFIRAGVRVRPPVVAVDGPPATLGHAAILAAVPAAICVVRAADLVVLHANPAFAELTECPLEQLVGAPIAVARPEGLDPAIDVTTAIRAQLDAGRNAVFEVPRANRRGGVMWVQVTTARMPATGDGERWTMVFADVTARRQAQHEASRVVEVQATALRESQRRFQALWGAGMIGVAVSDNTGSVIEANDAYLGMVGYSRAELEAGAIRYTDLTPPEHHARIGESLRALEIQGFVEPWETETFHKDGTRIPVLVGVAAIDRTHNLVIVADLSERKRQEHALRRTEEQLRQAQKMDAIGRLAGGVAHDFNNLLTVILSYTEMALGDLPPAAPMYADLEEVRNAAVRASELTGQLLLFSRQQVMEAQVLDPNTVVTSLDRMLRRLVGEAIDLQTLPGDGLGRVRLDPSQLEQVIVNLAVNARDAMPDGGKLTIETDNVELDESYAQLHVSAKAGRHVVVSVSDSGCGMDRETQARIFDPFFTTKQLGKGTGLGLSIVFGIVQQAGGHVAVYSEPGHGTTFKLYFPRVDAEIEPVVSVAPPATLRGTETILLVEDEDPVRRVTKDILIRHGYHVLEARSPGEALLACEQEGFGIHLLLTDVVMPQMSGPDLARRLMLQFPAMRVLCMSGYTDESIVRHGVLEPGVAFVQKPLTPQILTRKIREVLDRGRPIPIETMPS